MFIGMTVGETKVVSVPPEQGFGKRIKELVVTVDRSTLPQVIAPQVGAAFQIPFGKDSMMDVEITRVTQDIIEFDGNHQLAGRELVYEITLLEIKIVPEPIRPR